MSFYGSSFSFDGVSCEEYNLMVYDFGSTGRGDSAFVTREPFEDRLPGGYTPLYYGSTLNRPLEFSLVFGVNTAAIDRHIPMDHWDMEGIAAWLTGPDGYRNLEIEQGDLDAVRYKCMVSELRQVTVGWSPWAMACKVRCDSPYGYLCERVFTYNVQLGLTAELYNRGTHCGYYLPKLKITGLGSGLGGRSVSIRNLSDGGRETALLNIPAGVGEITLDQRRGVITNSAGVNLYDHFNHRFCRLVRGKNTLQFSGVFTAGFHCEFPVNVGG